MDLNAQITSEIVVGAGLCSALGRVGFVISQRKKHMQMIWHDYILINLNIEAMLEFLNLCFADTPKWAEQSPAPTNSA